jgi:hypothetical protein
MGALKRVKARGAILHRVLPVLVWGVLAPSTVFAQSAVGTEPPARVWIGPDGNPLPFQNDDEVLEFLRTGRVVSRKRAPEGIHKPDVLMLESDGVRARAVFRQNDEELTRVRIGERFYFRFRDCHAFECAAYALARRLGIDLVPPTVPRTIGRTPGSVQIWIEGDRDETAPGFQPRSPTRWVRSVWDKDFFDNLILNVDRNVWNILVDPNDQLWLIDHTRAFQPQAELLAAEVVQKVNRRAWERLQAMSDGELKDVVREHLDSDQLDALVQRRELMAEHVEGLLARLGEDAVFY